MIDLLGGFFIEAEDYGFALLRRSLVLQQDGVRLETIRTIGYFHTLHDCISEIIHQLEREAVKNGDLATLECFLDKLSFIEGKWSEQAKNGLLVDSVQKGDRKSEREAEND